MDSTQNKHSSSSGLGNVRLRGFRDRSGFDVVANIRNKSALNRHGKSTAVIETKMIENLVSAEERLQIAEVDGIPVSFIFVMKEGSMQLDEYGTSEGKTWLYTGPTSLFMYEKTDVEKRLLQWLIQYAREMGISSLIRFIRPPDQHMRTLLESEGFGEVQRYYHMQLEMTEPPVTPRMLPDGLELVDYRGEEDLDMVWSVLEAAFDYKEKDDAYKDIKHLFGSLESAYMPICVEKSSQNPIGTIVAAEMKTVKGTTGVVATFGVIPSFQGKGIGSLLMEWALNYFWQSGARTVELSVRVKNRQALRIYERFGFQIIPNRTIIVLVKDL